MDSFPPGVWWSSRRPLFNRILLSAGPISFLTLLVVGWIFESRLPCLEITLPSIIFGGILFAFFLGMANVLYSLGPITESLIAPVNSSWFRTSAFAVGTFLCVVLLFFPVIGNLVAAWTWSPNTAICEE